MLQLNTYQVRKYSNWLKKRFFNVFTWKSLVLPALLAFLTVDDIRKCSITLTCLFIAFILLAATTKIKSEKKPFSVTARVKRLIICLILLYSFSFFAFYIFNLRFLLAVIALLVPLYIFIAVLIMMPIEKTISNHYLNDAKRKLKNANNLTLIGITGSYGKTSTKYTLAKLLCTKYNVLMTPESYNTPMGVTKTVRGFLNPTTEMFIAEMGAMRKGEINQLCKLTNPVAGMLSSVGPQHLETFKTIETVISTKFELADHVWKNGGVMFLNYNNEYIAKHEIMGMCVKYGVVDSTHSAELFDVWAENISVGSFGCDFDICFKDGERKNFCTRLLGFHNVMNITGAVAVACHYGASLDRLVIAVRQLEPVPHRLELLKKSSLLSIIDDAYNSNPSGAKFALDTLSYFGGKKILVTPGMIELGDKEDELNTEFGRQAAAVCDLIILVGKKQTACIKAGALTAGYDEEKIIVVDDIKDAFKMFSDITEETVVLLENDLPDDYS